MDTCYVVNLRYNYLGIIRHRGDNSNFVYHLKIKKFSARRCAKNVDVSEV